ncbi:hypothetical protein [uncultured Nostoc sp.]|uniref:hypothetical protein n=1 Tax=uncultured Nostoc sp. TaxID=340711 RepID=UPI0035CC3BE5
MKSATLNGCPGGQQDMLADDGTLMSRNLEIEEVSLVYRRRHGSLSRSVVWKQQ